MGRNPEKAAGAGPQVEGAGWKGDARGLAWGPRTADRWRLEEVEGQAAACGLPGREGSEARTLPSPGPGSLAFALRPGPAVFNPLPAS